MKIGGVDPRTLPNKVPLVLPRGNTQIVFWAQGLPNLDEFEKLCPEPKVPGKMTQAGWVADPMEAGYQAAVLAYSKRRTAYLVVKSLAPSEIEWETVDMNVPGTWVNWEEDLKNNGFSQVECNLVFKLVWEANSLDDLKLKQARESFLHGPQAMPSA